MRAVFHLGLPKTGTTSIQQFLKANAEALSARGVAYEYVPSDLAPNQISQVELGFPQFARLGEPIPDPAIRGHYRIQDLDAQRAAGEAYERRFAEAVQARTEPLYLMSSEHVGAWTRTPAHAAALDDFLSAHFDDVRYVMYVRRQEDWVLSNYSQALRRGGHKTLGEFIRGFPGTGYMERLKAWLEVVGHDRFTLRLLEPDKLAGGDLVSDFARAVGFDPDGLPRPPRENESLSAAAAEFLRVANATLPLRVDGGRRRNPLMQGVQDRLTRWYADQPKLRLNAEQVARIRARNAEENAWICRTFFPGRAELFPPKPPREGEPDAGPTPEEVARVGIDLFAAIRSGDMGRLSEADRALLEGDGRLPDPPDRARPGRRRRKKTAPAPGGVA